MNLKIIAEAAQGFEGKYNIAKQLLNAAINAKSDSIKYQLVYADELCTKDYAHYQLFKSLELKDSEWKSLKKISKEFCGPVPFIDNKNVLSLHKMSSQF